MENEIWKDIPGYEGIYQVSNLGRLKSLPRKINNRYSFFISKEKFLKSEVSSGYVVFYLSKETITKQKSLHQLLAITFLNHIPCGHKIVVDHINGNRLDNRLENLQLITNRENSCKDRINGTSKYPGVCWDKSRNKWMSRMKINNKNNYLGRFDTEEEAYLAYQNKLKEII